MFRRLIPILYVMVVLVCLLIAFDFEGYMRSPSAWLAAVVLTLPWSLLSVLFMWALFHGAGLEVFTVVYMSFALLNGFILYRMIRRTTETKVS